jgi:toxin HigB-1
MSYRDKENQALCRKCVKEFSGFARQAELRLERLEAATSLKDLAALPSNRFEALKGNRQASIASV